MISKMNYTLIESTKFQKFSINISIYLIMVKNMKIVI